MNLSSLKKAPKNNISSDNEISMKSLFEKVFEKKESANDDHYEALSQRDDKSEHYVDTKEDLAELDTHVEGSMGKGGSSGSKKGTTAKIIEIATGKSTHYESGRKGRKSRSRKRSHSS